MRKRWRKSESVLPRVLLLEVVRRVPVRQEFVRQGVVREEGMGRFLVLLLVVFRLLGGRLRGGNVLGGYVLVEVAEIVLRGVFATGWVVRCGVFERGLVLFV